MFIRSIRLVSLSCRRGQVRLNVLPVQQRKLLHLRGRFLTWQQAQALECVEEQGLSALERHLPVGHRVVQLDHTLCRRAEFWVGANQQLDLAVPCFIGISRLPAFGAVLTPTRLPATGESPYSVYRQILIGLVIVLMITLPALILHRARRRP